MIDERINEAAELRDLYRELLLDHAKNPRHFGKLGDATHEASGINPLCGDKLKLYLRINNAGTIDASSFEGSGCAISVASASLLTDAIVGLDVPRALNLFEAVTRRITKPDTNDEAMDAIDVGKIRALDGVRDYPVRVKCATLAWHALNSAIHQHPVPTSTE